MRHALLILVGILVGALCTLAAMNAAQRANAFPRGVMAVLGHHSGEIRRQIANGQCEADGAQRHFVAVRRLADDLQPAFVPTGMDDALFLRYTDALREVADRALANPAADCTALGEQLGELGGACQACHRDFN